MSILCSMVGASFTVAAAAEVIRKKTSILAAGSTTSTTQSKFGGSSATFNGSSQYINVPNQTQLDISAYSNWTIECWARLTDGTSRTILNKDGITGSAYPGYTFYTNGSKQVTFGVGGSAGNWITITRSTALADNTWYHLAAVKSGSTVTFYVDGVSAGTATFVGYTDQSRPLYIGWEASGTYMYGYIDEVRISNSARYTTTFTSSTTAFVNDADTVFLMHANGTNASTFFEDDNGVRAPKGLFAVNQAQIDTAQYKFGGASALFDGTGDYIQSSVASDLQFTDNFTVELWVRLASTGAIRVPIGNRSGGPGAGVWWVEIGTDQTGYTAWQNTAGTSYYPAYSGTISTNTWTHLAVVRNGSTLTFYKDGVGGTAVTSVTGTFGLTNGGIFVGGIAASFNWNGHIDEVRISNSARYTANFTPSTSPFTNDANTLLLMHCDGTDATTVFRDDNGARAPKGITANGGAQISTTQSKFGGTSAYFDGNDDYLKVLETPAIGTGNFTIECWAYVSNVSGSKALLSIGSEASGRFLCMLINQAIKYDYYGLGDETNNSATYNVSANTWTHLAWVRSGSTLNMYVNGAQATKTLNGTAVGTNSVGNTGGWWIGTNASITDDYPGYIDELRISNIARYTTTFTAPTAPFQNDADTLLLIHADGSNASTVFVDDNGIAPYTP